MSCFNDFGGRKCCLQSHFNRRKILKQGLSFLQNSVAKEEFLYLWTQGYISYINIFKNTTALQLQVLLYLY